MSWPLETSADAAGADTALVPVGSVEQHGRHLPLTTDSLVATAVAERLAADHGLRRLPVLPVSCSHEHAAFAGSVSVPATTLYRLVADVAASLRADGVRYVVVVNGHGGNHVLGNVVQERSAAGHPTALFPQSPAWTAARADAGLVTSNHEDMHAGELETSILLHRFPEAVRPGWADVPDHLADDRRFLPTTGVGYYAPSGVIGRPSAASAGKGERLLASLSRQFGEYLAVLRA